MEFVSAHAQFPNADRSLARLSISSVSTTSSGASSVASQAMSSASPASTAFSSTPPPASPLPEEPEEADDGMDVDGDVDVEAQVKMEPTEEEEVPGVSTALIPAPLDPPKRGRGRPRKHPIVPKSVQKVTKGRSKTGCITCRRRKKKCDETKPECNNCVKNAVLCEGYPEKTVWQPGRQRHSDASALLSASLSIVPCPKPCLPTLVEGVDDMLDRKLLSHFTVNLSRVLTLFSDKTNPFVSLLLPMAAQKPALMHSLLCVSSSHLWTRTNQRNVEYLARQDYHFSKAVKFFWMDVMPSREADPETADCATAITMLFCLDTIAKGDTQGQYKVHLQSAGPLYRASLEVYRRAADQRHGTEFNKFLWEFFAYHDVLNSITSLEHRPGWFQNIVLPGFVPGAAGALLGVFDGLFSFLSRITVLRDEIRRRRALHENPSEFLVLEDGLEIDLALRQWQPQVTQEQDPLRFFSSQLYRQCTWVYLYRTIKPSHPTSKVTEAVDTGLEYLRILPEESGAQSILLLPLFLLGCAAFEPRQRPEISRRFEGLYKWSGLGNIEPAHAVVKRMWVLMDEGDMDRTWDWEQIMKDMGQDFLVT